MYAEYTFMPFGGDVYADEYWKTNGYKKSIPKVTYNVDNDKIAMYIGSGKYDIELPGNALTMKAEQITQGEVIRPLYMQFMRIVGTVSLNVDSVIRLDSLQQIIEAYTAKPTVVTTYTITDGAIASVDEIGLLTAKLAGTTYLKAETDDGIAVLKITVIDKHNPWHDFSRGLGKSFDEIKQLWGKRFYSRGNSNDSIRYYYDNDYVDRVDIYQHDNIADSIIITFKENVSDDFVREYLNQKFVPADSLNDWYTDNKVFLLSSMSARYGSNSKAITFTYFEPDWDDRRYDYGLTIEELIEKYHIPEENHDGQIKYNIKIKNDFISKITYHISGKPQKVTSYSAVINLKFNPKIIDDYIKKKYLFFDYNSNYKYGKNVIINGKDYILLIRRENINIWFDFIEN